MDRHWALPLIGRPWSPTGEGPDTFSCWGLVRWVFRERFGIDMPVIRISDFAGGENVSAIKKAAQASGFRLVEGVPADGDIVLMWGPEGRHVGLMIFADRKLLLLHSAGHRTANRNVGSVVAQPLAIALSAGYHGVELWRRAE